MIRLWIFKAVMWLTRTDSVCINASIHGGIELYGKCVCVDNRIDTGIIYQRRPYGIYQPYIDAKPSNNLSTSTQTQ